MVDGVPAGDVTVVDGVRAVDGVPAGDGVDNDLELPEEDSSRVQNNTCKWRVTSPAFLC